MKNIKIKYKIVFLMILFLTFFNNASGYEVYEGVVTSQAYTQTSEYGSFASSTLYNMDVVCVKSGGIAKDLKSVTAMIDISAWAGSHDYPYIKQDVTYEYNSVTVGTGYMYYWLMNTDSIPGYDEVYIKCYFDDGLDIPSGAQEVDIIGDITSLAKFDRSNQILISGLSDDKQGVIANSHMSGIVNLIEGYHTSTHKVLFYNNYSYWYNEDLFNFVLTRNISNPSMLYINNEYIDLINETSYNDVITNVYSDDIVNDTWNIEIYDINSLTHEFQIVFIPEIESVTPTLTTDKLLYNTSEEITISFTNIDEVVGYVGDSLSLYILYPIIDDYRDYDAKYMLHLYGDRRDETFTVNTSFLTPENEYHLAVCIDGDFHQIDDSIIISDTFYVYADNEYLTTSCSPESNCYTYNDAAFKIYYKINNNSNIIIKDDEGNTIQTYYNIIDEGEINYNIPLDENQLNTYPNWKIYLNNTEYSTSYNTDVTVYWSLVSVPEPTPIYTKTPTDENVSEQIDQLKEESKPIFDLIFGLSELVVDNPDYDDDNIITEYEMNNWFNSLIRIVLILLIFIVYTGLTKKR